MIVSELVTNAVNHAFDQEPGLIRVEASYHEDAVQCQVQDNGTRSGRNPRGRGLEIVEALVGELRGRFAQRFSVSGSVSTLVFPVVSTSLPKMTGARNPQLAPYPSNP
jgi:two-component sensor histidine kinase